MFLNSGEVFNWLPIFGHSSNPVIMGIPSQSEISLPIGVIPSSNTAVWLIVKVNDHTGISSRESWNRYPQLSSSTNLIRSMTAVDISSGWLRKLITCRIVSKLELCPRCLLKIGSSSILRLLIWLPVISNKVVHLIFIGLTSGRCIYRRKKSLEISRLFVDY